MSDRIFLDTNVLIYAIDTTHGAAHKRHLARKIIRQGNIGLSAQVLAEFYVTATRKLKRPVSAKSAIKVVNLLCQHDVVSLDASLVRLAIAHSQRYQISFWDGAIIAAAEALGAKIVFSEDLNHGQIYGDVVVQNPFL